MTSLFRLGQRLMGSAGTYTITKQIYGTVWLATNQNEQDVVIKGARDFGLYNNERDILKRFQDRTPYLRPLIDEIQRPSDPPALVLKYLDDNLLNASATQQLTNIEVKQVARKVLEALKTLHEDGYVHTAVQPDNVLVNYGTRNMGFREVQLADLGHTVRFDSAAAKDRILIGGPLWRSPEVWLELYWGTATDIWYFGTMLITLMLGDNWFIFKPDVTPNHEEYNLRILMKQHQYFGPFPKSYTEIGSTLALAIITHIHYQVPGEKVKPFEFVTEREISKEDKVFLLNFMKLDPRDRPTAKGLLRDEWFSSE